MSEKVKVTQKQSDWLDRYELTQEQVDHYIDVQPYRKRPDSPIVDWSSSKVARALYIGYEVKPEYSVGDWIYNIKVDRVAQIDDRYELGMEELWVDDEEFNFFHINDSRHATDLEIEQEIRKRTDKRLDELLLDLTSVERIRLYNKLSCNIYD